MRTILKNISPEDNLDQMQQGANSIKNTIKIKEARFVGDYVTRIRVLLAAGTTEIRCTTVYLVGGCWMTIQTVASHWSIIFTLVDARPNEACNPVEYIHL